MALSGSFIHSIKTGYRLVVEWTATQSISNNTSTITAKLYLESTSSGYNIISSADKTAWIEIDGARSTNNSTNVTLNGNQKKLMHTYVRTISHNSNGSKTFTLRASQQFGFTFAGSYTGTVTTGTNTFTLNTIPRASTISSFPNFNIDQSVDITISRASTSFTHKLVMYQGSDYIGQWEGIGTSITIDLTVNQENDIYDNIPNAESAPITLYCYTYSGSTQIGDRTSATATASVPSSIVPSFDTVAHSEYVSSIASVFSNYIQSKSRLSLEITGASGAKYSTIQSYKIQFNGNTYNSRTAVSSVVSSSGNLVITATVTDSRGRAASKNITVNVLHYERPKIFSFRVDRCDADGTLNEQGTYAKVNIEGDYSALNGENITTLALLSKERNISTYTEKGSYSPTVSFSETYIFETYETGKSYDFKSILTDHFGPENSEVVMSTAAVPFVMGRTGIGCGKYHEQGAVDAAGDIFVDGIRNSKAIFGYSGETQTHNVIIDTRGIYLLIVSPSSGESMIGIISHWYDNTITLTTINAGNASISVTVNVGSIDIACSTWHQVTILNLRSE